MCRTNPVFAPVSVRAQKNAADDDDEPKVTDDDAKKGDDDEVDPTQEDEPDLLLIPHPDITVSAAFPDSTERSKLVHIFDVMPSGHLASIRFALC